MQRDLDLANLSNCLMTDYSLRGAEDKKQQLYKTLPEYIVNMHKDCVSWIHDFEFFDTGINCIGVNVQNLIGQGNFSVRQALEKLFREIITLTNSQSGGIGFINFDTDISKYITVETDDELSIEISSFLENLNTFIRKGCEMAYTTLNIGLDMSKNGRRITKIILTEFEKGFIQGKYIFPNIVFKLKNGINVKIDDINYDLFELSCQVTSKCMIPTYFNTDTKYNIIADPRKIGIMGCRTRVVKNRYAENTSLFRGNIASTTINLVQLALNGKDFYKNLDRVMLDGKKMLIYRLNQIVKNANLDFFKNKNIYISSDKSTFEMLKNGTLSIGFIGLYECASIVTGHIKITADNLEEIDKAALDIIKFMRKIIDNFNLETEYQFSLLASSAEGVSGKFPKYDLEKFGEIDNITNKKYYTNSFHIPVDLNISCFNKINYEAKYHKFCDGGCITYVEFKESPAINVQAVIEIVHYAYFHELNYFGINFPVDICKKCGNACNNNDICENCGSDDILKLRRVSGYLSDANNFSMGKKNELKDRISHESNFKFN